jgi:acyl-coenzyme A thioesterase PaaI-like protein
MNHERIEIPKLRGHCCFACGTENPIGLNLQFYRSNESICTDITLSKYHEGWQNMAHGGIISTLLDEVMSWTIIYFKRIFFVTRRMEIKYIRPVLIGVPLTVKGHLTGARNPPLIGAIAEVFDKERQLLAKATGEFVELPEDKMALVPQELKEDMVNLFNRFGESFHFPLTHKSGEQPDEH